MRKSFICAAVGKYVVPQQGHRTSRVREFMTECKGMYERVFLGKTIIGQKLRERRLRLIDQMSQNPMQI